MSYTYNLSPFSFSFTPCIRQPLSWIEETRLAARKIADSTTKPIWLCSSGGIDSEVMCEAFYAEKIPFSILTLSHNNGQKTINDHDISYATAWCNNHGVKQKVVSVNLVKEVINRTPDYVTGQVFRYLQIRVLQEVENLGGFGVLGGGEQLYYVDEPILDPYLLMHTGYTVPLEWCKDNGLQHEPYFYFSTSEMVQAWLNNPIVNFALTNPEFFRHPVNKLSLKIITIRSLFPNQDARRKFDGFEKVKDLQTEANNRLLKVFGDKIQAYRKPISEIRSDLVPNR